MNSLFSHYDRTVSRRLTRQSNGSTYYGAKRRPATTEKLQAGETYGMARSSEGNNHHHHHPNYHHHHHHTMSSMRAGGQSSSYGNHNPYENGVNSSGSSGRFLQDIHIPSRSQRMPTPMPMRHHQQHHREMLGRSSSLPSRKYLESNMGHESSEPPSQQQHPLLLRSVSRKGTARGTGAGSSGDTNSLLGGSGATLEGASSQPGVRRRHKSDSAAMYMAHVQQDLHPAPQPMLVAPTSLQPPPPSNGVRAASSHGVPRPGAGVGANNSSNTSTTGSTAGSRWQLQLPDINSSGASAASSGSSGAPHQQQQQQQQAQQQVQVATYTSSKRGKSRHHQLHASQQQQQAEPEFLTQGGPACGLCTIKGLKPGNPNWQNQDSFIISEGVGPKKDMCIYAVLDGHGEVGHLVSNRCREQLPLLLAQVGFDPSRACRLMQQDLVACQTMDVQCSGATCVLAVLRRSNNTLTVANLGDSRCVLGRLQPGGQQQPPSAKGGSTTGGVSIMSVPLTRDHKPDRPDEHQRILAAGGQVGCRQIILSQRTSHPVTLPMGPPRVWYQCRGEIMGLAMSRSLGDSIVHTVGGSSEPEITEYKLCPGDSFMIIASDGIWDVVDNNQAIQIVQSYASRNPEDWDAKEAANILSRFARHRWQTVSSMVDDITCLVVKLPSTTTATSNSSIMAFGAAAAAARMESQEEVEEDEDEEE